MSHKDSACMERKAKGERGGKKDGRERKEKDKQTTKFNQITFGLGNLE